MKKMMKMQIRINKVLKDNVHYHDHAYKRKVSIDEIIIILSKAANGIKLVWIRFF